jgi:hypothetical protein
VENSKTHPLPHKFQKKAGFINQANLKKTYFQTKNSVCGFKGIEKIA